MRASREFILVCVLFVGFIAWGSCSEYQSAQAAQENRELLDSISTLDDALEATEGRVAAAEARVDMVEERYAQDSVVRQEQIDTLVALAGREEANHDVIGDSIRARLDEETAAMFDRQTGLHESLLAGRDSIIAKQAADLTGLRVRVAEWMVLADERQVGWDTEKEARMQVETRAALWEMEAARLGNPSLIQKVISGLPWAAAGYLGGKISP